MFRTGGIIHASITAWRRILALLITRRRETKLTTTYEDKAAILADLWLNYRKDEEFSDFCEYNDIGLPLAYVIANEIVESTVLAESFINETFELFLKSLEVEDAGFESLDEVFSAQDE